MQLKCLEQHLAPHKSSVSIIAYYHVNMGRKKYLFGVSSGYIFPIDVCELNVKYFHGM